MLVAVCERGACDDVTLVDRSLSRLTVRGQGSLILSDVTSRDTGVYTCRAMNAQDAVDASAHVRVIGMLCHKISVVMRVVAPVSLSLCNALTAESLDLESCLFFVHRISRSSS